MSYTMEDFTRDYMIEHFSELPAKDQVEVLRKLPPERLLAGLSAEEIRKYLEKLTADTTSPARKPRRKQNEAGYGGRRALSNCNSPFNRL